MPGMPPLRRRWHELHAETVMYLGCHTIATYGDDTSRSMCRLLVAGVVATGSLLSSDGEVDADMPDPA